MDLSWLANLTKPISNILNPLTERIGKWIERKPKLYVHFHPMQLVWTVGKERQADGSEMEVMHAHVTADFNHDHDQRTLVIVDVYPEGTQNRIPGLSQFQIAPNSMMSNYHLTSFAVPVIGQKGEPWIGRLILVDQFQRKHKTKLSSDGAALLL